MLSARAFLGTWPWAVALFVVLVALGFSSDVALIAALTSACGLAVAAVGMDVMTGYAGQPLMGQGAFMAIGAYVSTAMMANYGWSLLPALGMAILISAGVAVILGAGALRLAHIGLALVTFAFAFVVFTLANGEIFKQWTGQSSGRVVPVGTLGPIDFYDPRSAYFGSLAALLIVTALSYLYVHSRHGRILMAIKRSELLPRVFGVNVLRAKMVAMVWSSICGGLGGVIYAQTSGFVTPEAYVASLSILVLAIAAVGGLGTIVGPAAAAFLYGWLSYQGASTSGSGLWWPVLFMAVLIFSPSGLFGIANGAWTFVKSRVRPIQRIADAKPVRSPDGDDRVRVTYKAVARSDRTALTVDGVTLRYGGVTALDEVSFIVREGEVHALIGPNGAGKTSMLDVLTGVTPVSSGHVHVFDVDATKLPAHRRVALGMTRSFQHAALVNDLTVLQNIELVAENAAGRSRRASGRSPRASAEDALRLLGIEPEVWKVEAEQLTGGLQKLVDIARAFASDANLILLDEPTSGVTEHDVDKVSRAVASLRHAGRTVVVIDHNVEFVRGLADSVTVLDFGRVIATGTPESVLRSPDVIKAFLGEERTIAN